MKITNFFTPAATGSRYQKDEVMDGNLERNERMEELKQAAFEETKMELEATRKRKQREVEEQCNLLLDDKDNTTVLIFGSSGTHYWEPLAGQQATFLEDYEEPMPKKKKTWNRRPAHWREIAAFFVYCRENVQKTRGMYQDFLGNYDQKAAYKVLQRWKLDLRRNKELKPIGATASYGVEIDTKLHNMVQKRMRLGLPIDNFILRTLLLQLLDLYGKSSLLKENGGTHTFESTWADRFFKRWNIRRHVATST